MNQVFLNFKFFLNFKTQNDEKEEKNTKGRTMLRSWLNKNLRIIMTDGRILIGSFLCTDSKANVILGMCSEFTKDSMDERILGLVMVPGRHIVNICVDMSEPREMPIY